MAERDNGVLITYMLYKWNRDFKKLAYKAGKRAKREHVHNTLFCYRCELLSTVRYVESRCSYRWFRLLCGRSGTN
ncbi:hypothetical protein T4D_8621 [Trichinella pseudospiralis]|uniref:Uncharacterized protein n=1 Tax=Trichinella pseudospiralis TaxID=6337 RepID=A0A0V1FTB0_TRIPS|nr:hypothetical protein T4D_8621 [Trichinella pseudospiralis]